MANGNGVFLQNLWPTVAIVATVTGSAVALSAQIYSIRQDSIEHFHTMDKRLTRLEIEAIAGMSDRWTAQDQSLWVHEAEDSHREIGVQIRLPDPRTIVRERILNRAPIAKE